MPSTSNAKNTEVDYFLGDFGFLDAAIVLAAATLALVAAFLAVALAFVATTLTSAASSLPSLLTSATSNYSFNFLTYS